MIEPAEKSVKFWRRKVAVPRELVEALRKMEEHLEQKLTSFCSGYIDAHRKGTVLGSGYCCADFADFAFLYWNPDNARIAEPIKSGLYLKEGIPVMALEFRGRPFNWCPFCGRKV